MIEHKTASIGETFRAYARRSVQNQAALQGQRISPEEIEARASETIENFVGPWRFLAPEPDRVGQLIVLRRYDDGPVVDSERQEVSAEQVEAYERSGASVYIVRFVTVQSGEAG